MDNDVVDYEIAFDDHAGALETQDEAEALHHAIFAALEGADRPCWTPWVNRGRLRSTPKLTTPIATTQSSSTSSGCTEQSAPMPARWVAPEI